MADCSLSLPTHSPLNLTYDGTVDTAIRNSQTYADDVFGYANTFMATLQQLANAAILVNVDNTTISYDDLPTSRVEVDTVDGKIRLQELAGNITPTDLTSRLNGLQSPSPTPLNLDWLESLKPSDANYSTDSPGRINLPTAQIDLSYRPADVRVQMNPPDTSLTVSLPQTEIPSISVQAEALLRSAAGQRPDRPSYKPDLVLRQPDTPDPSISTLDLPDIPGDFTKPAPEIDTSGMPVLGNISLPINPDELRPQNINYADIIGDPPDLSALPAVPVLSEILLPAEPVLELPEWNIEAPEFNIATPSYRFEFTEVDYSSDVLPVLQAKILADLQNGGYGIEPNDEARLWDRLRDRESRNALARVDESARQQSARGFAVPPGALWAQMDAANQQYRNDISTANREIALKRSELYVQNRQFMLGLSQQVEGMLLNYHASRMERALNVSKFGLDAALQLFNVEVTRFRSQMELYQAKAAVFRDRLQAVLTQVDIYKTQMEGARLKSDMQKDKVAVYQAQLDGVRALIEVYNARTQHARLRMETEQMRLSALRSVIDAYTAQVGLKEKEFSAYEAKIRSQQARVQAFSAEVDVYRTRVDAAGRKAGMAVEKYRAETERNKQLFDKFSAQLEAERARISAETERLNYLSRVYSSDLEAYNAHMNALTRAMELGLAENRAVADIVQEGNRNEIEKVRLETERLRASAGFNVDKARLEMDASRAQAEINMHMADRESDVRAEQAKLSQEQARLAMDASRAQAEINANHAKLKNDQATAATNISLAVKQAAFDASKAVADHELRQADVEISRAQAIDRFTMEQARLASDQLRHNLEIQGQNARMDMEAQRLQIDVNQRNAELQLSADKANADLANSRKESEIEKRRQQALINLENAKLELDRQKAEFDIRQAASVSGMEMLSRVIAGVMGSINTVITKEAQ